MSRCKVCGCEKDGNGEMCVLCFSRHWTRCMQCHRERSDGQVVAIPFYRIPGHKCANCLGTGWVEAK